MKKLFVFLLACTVIGTAVFAQDADKAPEATYGFSGSFEMDALKANNVNNYDGNFNEPVSKVFPWGLNVTAYKLSPWVQLDWSKVSMKAEATYDGFKADDDDFSTVKLTTTVPEFYGFEVKSVVEYKNENLNNAPVANLTTFDHTVTATYTNDDITFFVDYGFGAGGLRAVQIIAPLDVAATVLDGFKKIGWELDTDGLAAKVVFAGTPRGNMKIDEAWVEGRNMFGVWTSKVNEGDDMGFRQGNLGVAVSEDRDKVSNEMKVGAGDNKVLEGAANTALLGGADAINWLNTIAINDALTVKAGVVVPYNANVAFLDWLKDNALNVGVEYVLADIGTISAGALVNLDYTSYALIGGEYLEGKSKMLAAWAASESVVEDGFGFWTDATIDGLVPGMKLFVALDGQFGSYVDLAQYNEDPAADKTDAENAYALPVVGASNWNFNLEAGYDVSDALAVSAALYAGIGMGLDYEKATGAEFDDTPYENISGSWGEADAIRLMYDGYGVNSTMVKAHAKYKVNDMLSVWAGDYLTLNENYIVNNQLGEDATAVTVGAALPAFGYFHKNTVDLGVEMKANDNVTLKLSTELNMYLGVPTLSYADGTPDAAKDASEEGYKTWKTNNLTPYVVKAAFSYSY